MFSISLQLLFSAENYVRNVRDSLDYLHKEVKSIDMLKGRMSRIFLKSNA